MLARVLRDFAEETAGTLAKTARWWRPATRGDASEADAARAETAKLEAEQAVDAATQQLGGGARAARLSSGSARRPTVFEVDDTLPARGRAGRIRRGRPRLAVALAEANRPDLAAAGAQLRSAEAASRWPDAHAARTSPW